MNSSGLNGNSLAAASLEPMDALRASAAVNARVPDVSTVDDNPLATPGSEGGNLVPSHQQAHGQHHSMPLHANHGNLGNSHNTHGSHNTHNTHGNHNTHANAHNAHNTGAHHHFPVPFPYDALKLAETVAKLENEATTMSQDMAYLRHVLDFQNSKVEKLTQLLIDLLHNKDMSAIVTSLQAIQNSDPFNVEDAHNSVEDSLSDSIHEQVHEVHDAGQIPLSSQEVSVSGVSLDTNMDPQLHQVAQAAVQAQDKSDDKGSRKRPFKANERGGKHHKQNHLSSPHNQQNQLSHNDQHNNQHHNNQHTHNDQHNNHNNHNNLPGNQLGNQASNNQNLNNQISNQISNNQISANQISNNQLESQLGQGQTQNQTQASGSSPAQNLLPQLQNQIAGQHIAPRHQSPRSPDLTNKALSIQPLPQVEVVTEVPFGRVKPKMNIEFVHNPMTVREIWLEFTKGYRGQPPLREMDERYGKYEWRGDSRTKQSKRFQRRRKLCEAIERGMEKYDKTADEIINYIEDFRGEKSLTWVMNGNLPEDIE